MAEIKVRVGQKNAIKVTSSLAGNAAGTIGELSDVNASNPQNGMVSVSYTHLTLPTNREV